MKLGKALQLAGCGIVVSALLGSSFGQHGTSGKKVAYAKVAALLKTSCVPCHNDKQRPEKVDLSSYSSLMASGEHGPIVIPGHPEKSKIVMYVDGEKQPRMPFKKTPLNAADISLLKRWIAGGAKNSG